jgi:guanylate kinase
VPAGDPPAGGQDAALIFIVSGPGGVGKGTIVDLLVEQDPRLWLSRSWTTRERRSGEAADSYTFVDRDAFEARIESGGFLEWTDFLGQYYGTPMPEHVGHRDIVLEIEVDGASQVKRRFPEAVLIFLLPPSREEQQRRLRGRGDAEDKVEQRLQKALDEEPIGLQISDHVVVNDDLADTVRNMMAIIESHRSAGTTR